MAADLGAALAAVFTAVEALEAVLGVADLEPVVLVAAGSAVASPAPASEVVVLAKPGWVESMEADSAATDWAELDWEQADSVPAVSAAGSVVAKA